MQWLNRLRAEVQIGKLTIWSYFGIHFLDRGQRHFGINFTVRGWPHYKGGGVFDKPQVLVLFIIWMGC